MEPRGIHRSLNESMEEGLNDFITAEFYIKDGFTAIDAVNGQTRAGGIGLADALGSALDETPLEGAIKNFLLMFHKHIDAGMLQQVDDAGTKVNHTLIEVSELLVVETLQDAIFAHFIEESEQQTLRFLIGEQL